ncbi:SID1 transmembrane family member 2-like isoform X1 [Myxocyprinus asiaticus]|uniref:SID1 transmembrane family member 2-like isoform X1 n=1 Tax=Myxocyprinus asiaticus TaxID=70543 RepID=UPI002221DAF0|nr:SID1 transmembrane family member 2-like isoform X1 [Myxocyprinus asiaticus]
MLEFCCGFVWSGPGCLVLMLVLWGPVAGGTNVVIQRDAQFDVTYYDTVTSDNQTIYSYNHTVSRNKTEGVRVSVELLSESAQSPVLFVIRQKQAVLSFQVPLILRGLYQRKYQYTQVGRTLCQPPMKVMSEMQFFYIDVSTLSSAGIHYQLRVSRVDSFTLQTDKKFSFNATPSQPQFFKYVFPDGVDTVIVKVNSQKNFPCSVMSIQDIQCPVYDLDNNVAFIGMYQTMTTTSAITVQRKDFPSNSFYVVVVVKTEDEACGGPLRFYPLLPDELLDAGNRSKTLDVIVSPAINSEVYVMGMLFCFGIFLSFYLLTFLVACVENKRMNRKREGLLNPADTSPAETASLLGKAPVSPYEYGSFADNGSTLSSEAVTDSLASTDGNYGYMDRSLESVGRCRQESLSSVEEDDYDTLADIDSDKNIVRTKKFLCVSDLARKDKRILSKKYQIYFWNIATIGVFYALPVIQLVITYQTVVNVTGNQDICYYNFLCAHPLGALSSFNNILSNLGYVMLGLLFLFIILQRDILHNRALERKDSKALECGIPKHFGLYYAMGTALMMEGLLSACYHVCPNYTNFQFDTSFMYMIAGLCMLKLYQKRHPDINASAYSAYACLAAVIFFSVLGVVFGKGNTVFWIVFSVIHILATLLLSTQLYYMGRWRLNSGILRRMLYVIYTDCIRQCSGPMYIDRMVLLVMGNIVNWSLAAYGLIKRPNDFASYLLAIAICNLLLYFAFYIIMKLRSGERIQCLALVCILFTAVVWGFALFFFFQGLSTWQKTPAESREHNRECILLSFFDDHDIWHFLSSIAMFGSFLVLLTMDDDLDTVQRDKIYVF